MNEKERYDLESRISAARCELYDAKKNIAELHEIMERQAESNARLIAEALKKDEEIGQLQEELHEAKSELLKYREAEHAGRMVVLPCKVGDDVWFVRKFGKERCITKREVDCVNIDSRGNVFVSARRISGGYIGKTVFLTREEAEAALKGGEG